jgi:hypothetical protein
MSWVAAGTAAVGLMSNMASKAKENDAAAAAGAGAAPPPIAPLEMVPSAVESAGKVKTPKPVEFRAPDFTKSFNSKMNEQEGSDFKMWLMDEFKDTGKDWKKDMADYDVQGFFKAGETLRGGHGTDKYKKPSHPTFSNESIYSGSPSPNGGQYIGGQWGREGDRDTYTPHQSQFDNGTHNEELMRKYFGEEEEGNKLILQ